MYVIHKAHLIFRIDPTTPFTSLIDRVGNPELCSVWVLCRYVIHISECYHCRGWKAHSSVWHAKIVMDFCRWLECLELVGSFIQLCQTAGLRQKKMLEAFKLYCQYCPFIRASYYFANNTILEAFKDAPRVHVVDYGILYGTQWPCLIHQLSEREGGPPHLRITGIDRPQPGFTPSGRIQETGRRLAELAKMKGVPFEFHAIAEKWEAITPTHLMLREDEVLAVNSMYRLHHLLDEQVTAASPRTLVLNRIRSINPKVFVQGVVNAGYNAPFFMSRFREALTSFSTLFEFMDESMPSDDPMRIIIDQEIVGRDILNVVACEGLERVERPEPYRQWQSRTMRAGFQQVPISAEFQDIVRKLMTEFHPKYGIGEDGNWFLIGWKERITHAITAWEPASVGP